MAEPIPRLPADAQPPSSGSIASQRTYGINLTHHGDAQTEWPPGGIPSDQFASMGIGQVKKPAGKAGEPVVCGLWQSQGQGEGDRVRPHGGQVRQVDRKGLVTERFGIDLRKKVPALKEHVGRYSQRPPRRSQQGTVIAHPEQCTAAPVRAREVPRNQVEFARHGLSAEQPRPDAA